MSTADLRSILSTSKHQIWILSEFGKPIFASCGCETELASTFALIQVFVRTLESWKDTLHCIQMDDVCIQFSYRSPLIFCVVASEPANLSLQLDMMYNQVLSILSKYVLKKTFAEKGDNFDLRRWLNGLDKRVDVCMSSFEEDAVVYLGGFRILPMNFGDREFLVHTMATAINDTTNTVAFSVLIAHRQLVAFARMKHLNLTASDFNILANLVECHESLRDVDTWVPLCLPHFNQNVCLYAFISYLWEETGPCLIMLSTDRNAFFDLRSAKTQFQEAIFSYRRFTELQSSVSYPESLSRRQRPTPELCHYMYKNTSSSQVVCCSPSQPFISLEEQKLLYKGYFRASDIVRKTKSLRILLQRQDEYTILAWITGNFELYAAFSSLITQQTVMEHAEKLLRFLRKEEKRVFFNLSPGLLKD